MSKDGNSVVKLPEKLGFASFAMGASIASSFKSLYYMIFLTNILKIPVMTTGVMMTVGTIWDIVNDPIVGVWANNTKFKSGERIRPFILYMSLPWAAGIVLMFTNFNVGQTLAVILAMVVFFFYEIANTFRGIVYNGMGGVASPYDSDRKSINAFRSFGGCVGSGIGSVAVTPLLTLFGGLRGENAIIGDSDAKPLFLTALCMGGLCVACCYVHYFTTKERLAPPPQEEKSVSFINTYKMLFRCKSWVWNMFYIMAYGICNTLINSATTYYAAYIAGSSAAATPIFAVYLVVSVITSLIVPKIDSLLGHRKTMFAGIIIQIVGKIPFIINPYSIVTIYISTVTAAVGAIITFVMLNFNRNIISDIVEIQNGRRMDAMVSTADNLALKIGEAAVTMGITYALSWAGFDESLKLDQTLATKHTICNLIGIIPTVVLVISLVFVFFLNIDKEKKAAKEQREETAE